MRPTERGAADRVAPAGAARQQRDDAPSIAEPAAERKQPDFAATKSRRKTRPQRGDPVTPGMSHRDIAAALGVSTGWISRCLRLAAVPADAFEQIVENDALRANGQRLSVDRIIDLSRGWDMPPKRRVRACPHCGKPIGGRR